MTNPQPIEEINTRLNDIDSRLDQLGDEIDLVRTIQEGVRRETRANSQALSRLERTTTNLVDIARLHQQGLRSLAVEIESTNSSLRETNMALRETNAALERLEAIVMQIIKKPD